MRWHLWLCVRYSHVFCVIVNICCQLVPHTRANMSSMSGTLLSVGTPYTVLRGRICVTMSSMSSTLQVLRFLTVRGSAVMTTTTRAPAEAAALLDLHA